MKSNARGRRFLVNGIYELNQGKFTKKDIDLIVSQTFQMIRKLISEGKTVVLMDFGSFSLLNRKPRLGVKPGTFERFPIPAKRVIKFKTSLYSERMLNNIGGTNAESN